MRQAVGARLYEAGSGRHVLVGRQYQVNLTQRNTNAGLLRNSEYSEVPVISHNCCRSKPNFWLEHVWIICSQ